MIHLDTSFLIRALNPGSREERTLLTWLGGDEAVALAAMVWAEFLCGPVTPEVISLARTLLGTPAPVSGADAELAAQLFNDTGRRRGSLVRLPRRGVCHTRRRAPRDRGSTALPTIRLGGSRAGFMT